MRANAAPDTRALRSRQRRALVRYPAAKPRDFLTVATPGSGKTAFALRVAGELLADGVVEQITVVVLSRHPGLLQLRELRRELNTLVSIAHHRTASRTAGSTTSCAGSAAAQRSLRRRRTNSRRAHRSGARPGRLGPCLRQLGQMLQRVVQVDRVEGWELDMFPQLRRHRRPVVGQCHFSPVVTDRLEVVSPKPPPYSSAASSGPWPGCHATARGGSNTSTRFAIS